MCRSNSRLHPLQIALKKCLLLSVQGDKTRTKTASANQRIRRSAAEPSCAIDLALPKKGLLAVYFNFNSSSSRVGTAAVTFSTVVMCFSQYTSVKSLMKPPIAITFTMPAKTPS